VEGNDMYISRYKRDLIAKRIIVIEIILLAILIGLSIYKNITSNNAMATMDKTELRYDADGPFIMINTEDDLIGYYIGSEPVLHYEYDEYIEEGVYDVIYNIDNNTLDLIKKSGEVVVSINMDGKDIELINDFKDSVALVY
jgi:hypothetical protein